MTSINDLLERQANRNREEMTMAQHDMLLLYSEWLDSEKLICSPEESGDDRTHDELAAEFLARR